MLDFSDCTITGVSILKSAADLALLLFLEFKFREDDKKKEQGFFFFEKTFCSSFALVYVCLYFLSDENVA